MKLSVKNFLSHEALSSIVLLLATILALIWANSPFYHFHEQFIGRYLFFINEGLMTLFFLLVSLELKKESTQYHKLSNLLLPATAALGGMVMPALIYIIFNYSKPDLVGWATPVATDIAFAIGVLSLVGRRIPNELRMFLLALAIFDDIGAILIIALFYSHGLSVLYLALAALIVLLLFGMNRIAIRSLYPYLILGVFLWYFLLHAGIHPTIGGVILGLFLPPSNLEEKLHPWVAFLIVPLFGLANAGFSVAGMTSHLGNSIVLGIIFGLFLGKQLGVFGSTWLLIRLRYAKLPGRCSWRALYGVSLICGIGFTMSLFLGTLSFQGDSLKLIDIRLGVLIGSLLSGITGAMILLKEKPH